MRPFQIVALAVFAVLAAVGLYLFASYNGITGGDSVGRVTIWGTLPSAAVQTTINELKQGNQRFTGVSYVERPAATFDRDVAEALAAGAGPDVIIITQEQLLTESSRITVIPFSTIPERTYRDSYASIAGLFLTEGGTYGIPLVIDPLVLYYNRDRISQAGLASPPQTWEEVLGATPLLTQKAGASIAKGAIALGTYSNIENARAILSLLFLQSGSSISQRTTRGIESTLTANSSAGTALSPAESALNFYTQFADPAKLVYTWNSAMRSARASFIAGDTALYIGFASEYRFISSANPNLDFDMSSIPFPQTASGRVDYAHVYALTIPKSGANVAGAYTVASILALPDYAFSLSSALGMAPAARSLLSARVSDVNAGVYYPLALISKGWLSPAPEVTDRIFAGMINSVINGGQRVPEALKDANDSLSNAL